MATLPLTPTEGQVADGGDGLVTGRRLGAHARAACARGARLDRVRARG